MKIAVIGRHQTLYNTVLELVAQGHEICSIVTSSAAPEYTVNESDFESLGAKLSCEVFIVDNLQDEAVLRSFENADIAVSVNWISIISADIIDLFSLGVLNAHCGDLPRYRGNACPNWALLSGESSIAACVHLMEGGRLDCGRIIAKAEMALTSETYIAEIYQWTEKTTPSLFVRAVSLLEKDPGYTLEKALPDASDGFRCYPRTPEDSYINWDNSAVSIGCLVRASSEPFAGAYTYFRDGDQLEKLYIMRASPHAETTRDLASPGQIIKNDRASGSSFVMCGSGILEIQKCRFEEGAVFSPGRFFKSIRMKLGVRMQDFIWMKTKSDK